MDSPLIMRVTITLRLLREQGAWLDARRKPGESRPAALRRLAKMPDMPPNAKLTGLQRAAHRSTDGQGN